MRTRGQRWLLSGMVILGGALQADTFGSPMMIEAMQWSIVPTYVYRSATGELNFENTGPGYSDIVPIEYGGGITVRGGVTNQYELWSATMQLTAASRVSDNSSGGRAQAWFANKSKDDVSTTLTIYGDIVDSTAGYSTVYSGLILTAEAVDSFRAIEDPTDMNRLKIGTITFRVTGGDLRTGQVSSLALGSYFDMSLDFSNCSQGGSAVTDFRSDIRSSGYFDPGVVQCTPEPSTMGLALLGLVLFRRPIRKGRN